MPQLEKTLVDKFVAGAYYGKRKIGRPMKYNIRNQGRTGWIELVFNPRTRVEQYISDAMKFAHPYIFAMTYKFHVEKAREAGKYLFSQPKRKLVLRSQVTKWTLQQPLYKSGQATLFPLLLL